LQTDDTEDCEAQECATDGSAARYLGYHRRMDTIALAPPAPADLDALLAFELENRAFFEATINARPLDYYSREGVARAIDAAIGDAANDRGYQFLVKSGTGGLLGRVNLTGIRRQHYHSGALGYRIGQGACGRGHASEAVRQVLEIAFVHLGLLRIEAGARVDNPGSIRVLERHAAPLPQCACPPPR
jgi:ribosomal-protein-alanine N-acetyltransferase